MTYELKQLCNTYRELHDYFQDKDDRLSYNDKTSLEEIEDIIKKYHDIYQIKDPCSDIQLYGDIKYLIEFANDVKLALKHYIFLKDYHLDKIKYTDILNKLYKKEIENAYETMQSKQPDIMDMVVYNAVKKYKDSLQPKISSYYSRAGKANKFKAKT